MAAVFPLLLARWSRGDFEPTRHGLVVGRASCSGRDPRPRRARNARSTSRSTTSSARRWACRSTSCAGSRPTSPRPTSRSASTSRPSSPSAPAGPPHFPALKIKCGGPADLATLRAVREVFAGPIRVDANTGWTPDDAEALLPALVDLGVELIEQPFPARAYDGSRWLQELSPLPIVADESALHARTSTPLVGVVPA